jgi:acetyl-CoA carboxylase biotin carboxyl carrier protein
MPEPDALTGPLDLALIRELCDLVEERDLITLDVTYKDFHVKLSRAAEPVMVPVVQSPAAPSGAAAAARGEATVELPPDDVVRVCAPLAGVFYRAPGPEAPPFVEEGALVSTGQVLCIIEAMKMMNEIAAEANGRVLKALVANGQVVEAGQEIFYLKPLA